MASLSLDSVTVHYPSAAEPALDRLDLEVLDGQFIAIGGGPGAGKSTLLRAVAGQEDLATGHVGIGGRDVTALPARDRDAVLVFQNYALYPHMDVQDNMGFALRVAGVPAEERAARVREAAGLLGLGDRLTEAPDSLTGLQRQQVALARAVVRRPAVLLLDDPLATLEPRLRRDTAAVLVDLVRALEVTTLYAATDPAEIAGAADRRLLLDSGRLREQTAVS